MPNANYVKGRKKEYKICKLLRAQGYTIVQRTAGSHSPIDVFAIHKQKRKILFVQSKPDNYPAPQAARIREEMLFLGGEYSVVFVLM